MWSRLLPSAGAQPRGFPIPLRRHAADDNAYTAALLVGCLIGVGLAWGVILGEGGRRQIMRRNGPPRYLGQSGRGLRAPAPVPGRPPTMECPDRRPSRPQQYELAMWPEITAHRWQIRGRGASRRQPWPCPYPSGWCWPKRRSRPSQRRRGGSVRGGTGDRFRRQQQLSGAGRNLGAAGLVSDCLMAVHIGWHCRQPSATTASRVRSPRRRSATIAGSPSAVSTGSPLGCASAELELAIEPGSIEHDPSRRVTLSARQVP